MTESVVVGTEVAEVKEDLSWLVAHGKKGVTNAQMIPAMKQYLADNDTEKLTQLKSHFPAIYASSVKYLGKENIAKLEALAIA